MCRATEKEKVEYNDIIDGKNMKKKYLEWSLLGIFDLPSTLAIEIGTTLIHTWGRPNVDHFLSQFSKGLIRTCKIDNTEELQNQGICMKRKYLCKLGFSLLLPISPGSAFVQPKWVLAWRSNIMKIKKTKKENPLKTFDQRVPINLV